MERAAEATHLDVLPSSIGTVGVTGCAGRRRSAGSAGAISFPEGPCAGPALLDRSGRELSGARRVGKGCVVALGLICVGDGELSDRAVKGV
jgi:hypothetical protein